MMIAIIIIEHEYKRQLSEKGLVGGGQEKRKATEGGRRSKYTKKLYIHTYI
jgi:hypothetical protein